MKVQSVQNKTNFNGRFIYDENLSLNQIRNFRLALKDMDLYKKDYNLRIFNDISMDDKNRPNEHYVCINAESEDRKKIVNVFLDPIDQKRLKVIKEKVSELVSSFEKKQESFWEKFRGLFK